MYKHESTDKRVAINDSLLAQLKSLHVKRLCSKFALIWISSFKKIHRYTHKQREREAKQVEDQRILSTNVYSVDLSGLKDKTQFIDQ